MTVAKLAQLLAEKTRYPCTPYQLRLPCRLGFWLTYRIDTVEALEPRHIVAGHQNRQLDDYAGRTISETRQYLDDADGLPTQLQRHREVRSQPLP